MKKILILIITLSSLALNAQVKTYKDQNTGDQVNRFVVNTNADGQASIGLITGTDTVWVSGYNNNINIVADTVRINGKLYVGTGGDRFDASDIKDTLDVHREDINSISNQWDKSGNYLFPKVITDSIGIGMNEPRSILDVAGRITISNTGNSVFIGDGAGELDDLSDNQNVFIGTNAGASTTTGRQNTAIGTYAMWYNQTGQYNVALGQNALQYIKGNGNVGIGYYANFIGNDYTTNYNTAIGIQALTNNRQSYNTALGGYAGANFISGNNTYPFYNVYVGYLTKSKTNADTNSIVIGANAIGNGSNTATIGDDHITDVYIGENGTANIHASFPVGAISDESDSLVTSNTIYDYVYGITGGANYWSGSDNYVYLNTIGDSVGIGTETPTEKLQVLGNAKATRFIATQSTGTSPLTVTSTTLVDNLNVEYLGGYDTSSFLRTDYPSTGNELITLTDGIKISSGSLTLTNPIGVTTIDTTVTDSYTTLPTSHAVVKYMAALGAGTVTNVTSTTTDQLTVATGTTTPAITIVTGEVTSGDYGLVTGDTVYDFLSDIYFDPAYSEVYVAGGSGLAISTPDTWVQVTGWTVDDYANLTTTTSQFTVVDNGKYKVNLSASFQYVLPFGDASTSSTVRVAIFVNGTEQTSLEIQMTAPIDYILPLPISGIARLETDDVVTLMVRCNRTGTFTMAYGNLTLHKIDNYISL